MVAYCANRARLSGSSFGAFAVGWNAVDRLDAAGSDDLDFFDELLDEGFALRWRAVVEDVVDVIGEGVEFVV
jgi:hypothetical protein